MKPKSNETKGTFVVLQELEIVEPSGHRHVVGGTVDLITGYYESIKQCLIDGKAVEVITNSRGNKIFISAEKLRMCTIGVNTITSPEYDEFRRAEQDYRDTEGNRYNRDGSLLVENDADGSGIDTEKRTAERINQIKEMGYYHGSEGVYWHYNTKVKYAISSSYVNNASEEIWATVIADAKAAISKGK